jgi:hypothetical protein
MKNLYLTKKVKKRYGINTIFLFGIAVIFITTTIFFAIYGAIVSDKLVTIEKKQDELTRANRFLSSDLVKSDSLSSLTGKTASLGFEKPSNVIYLREEETVASIR